MVANQNLFKIAAIFSIISAVYHFTGIFYPVNASSPLRHALFVIINLVCFYGFVKRPKYFILLFFILTIQQYTSHGSSLIRQWNNTQTVNWLDLSVIVLLPIFFINLILEFREVEKLLD